MAGSRTQEIVPEGTTALGAWIRVNRMDQRLSQRELASRSGLSRSYVCDIERGRGVHPSVETLDKLAAALGMARLDLLKAAGLIEPVATDRESTEERRILSVFRDLTAAGQQSVMQFARFVHAEEHQWVQANMLDGIVEPNGADVARIRMSGMASLFELDEAASR
jgi:transcriptional regulator with XRE-family HTH domain